jgi:hypothetical protein
MVGSLAYCQPVAVNAPVGALGWSQSVFFR